MADKVCPLCGAAMAFDDFTHAWVCSECGKSIADSSGSSQPAPDATPLNAPIPAPVSADAPTPVTSPAPASILKSPSVEVAHPDAKALAPAPVVPAEIPAPEAPVEVPANTIPTDTPAPVQESANTAPSTTPQTSPAPSAVTQPAATPRPAPGISAFAAASAPRTAPGARPAFPSARRSTKPVKTPQPKGPGPGYETITKARSLIAGRQFEQASKLLYDLKKKNLQIARSYILSMLCSYQVCTMPDLLTKISGSSIQLQKFADRPDWQIVSGALPGSRRVFVSDVIEFCVLTIALMGDAKKVINRTAGNNSPHLSSISRMDSEDVHNELRMRDIKKAKAAGYKTFQEIAEDYAERIWNDTDFGSPIPVEDPTPEAAHHLLPKNAQGSIVVASLRKLENTPLPEEDLKSRRSQLFSRIGEYEQEILSDTSKDVSTERK